MQRRSRHPPRQPPPRQIPPLPPIQSRRPNHQHRPLLHARPLAADPKSYRPIATKGEPMRTAIATIVFVSLLSRHAQATDPSQLEVRIGKMPGHVSVGKESSYSSLHVVIRNKSD